MTKSSDPCNGLSFDAYVRARTRRYGDTRFNLDLTLQTSIHSACYCEFAVLWSERSLGARYESQSRESLIFAPQMKRFHALIQSDHSPRRLGNSLFARLSQSPIETQTRECVCRIVFVDVALFIFRVLYFVPTRVYGYPRGTVVNFE